MRRAPMARRGNCRAVSRITRNASAVLLLSILAAACSETATSTENPAPGPGQADDPTTPPPEECKTPGALPESGWFTDITEETGLAGVEAIRVSSVDLN